MRLGFDAKRIFHNQSGLGNYGRDLVRILFDNNKKIKYVLFNPKKQNKIKWNIDKNFIESNPKGIWKYFSSLWRQGPINKQIKKNKIDIYHGLSAELPFRIKSKSIVTVHDLIFYRFPELYNPIDVLIHKIKIKHAVNNATRIVAISKQTKKDVISFLKVDKNRIHVIYQVCNPIFRKKITNSQKDLVVNKFKLPEKFVLFVGTLEKRKNPLIIARALKKSNYNMVFIGKLKNEGKNLKNYIRKNGMESRVKFIHNISIEDLSIIYKIATVFCYPSIFEGFGIPIIEALNSGIPVITSKGGCFNEAGGPFSEYINPKDKDELRNKIDMIFNESIKKRRERAINGFKYLKKFDEKIISNQWINLYESIHMDE
tara:strand:- start:1561 stop:2673 length:1113 start_codon:yes stop_codon:yes gene_type:complete